MKIIKPLLLVLTLLPAISLYSQLKKQGNMVLIPAKNQSFLIGMDKDEQIKGEPANGWARYLGKHKVTFTYDFFMDTTLVTQGEYQKLMGNNPSGFKTGGNLKLPVERVNWYDAVIYCNARSKEENLDAAYTYTSIERDGSHVKSLGGLKMDIKKNGYRLPTNAEYEYATRAKTTGMYFFAPDGKDIDNLGNQYSWNKGNSGLVTKPVATKKPNPWGLYDLIGNVFEWIHDWDNAYVLTDEVDPVGQATGVQKIAKGGSYKTDVLHHMRIPYHFRWAPESITPEMGFRCVRTSSTAILGIENEDDKAINQVLVYPNPSHAGFQFYCKGPFEYFIFNLEGKIAEQGKGEDGASVGESLRTGYYFLEIKSATGKQTVKLTKN